MKKVIIGIFAGIGALSIFAALAATAACILSKDTDFDGVMYVGNDPDDI